jgi:hypothetical protein
MKLTAKNITFSIGKKIIQPGESVELEELNEGLQIYIDLGRIIVETPSTEKPKESVDKPTQKDKIELEIKKAPDKLLDNETEAELYLNQNTKTVIKKAKEMKFESADIDLLTSVEKKGKNRKKLLFFLKTLKVK